jgi:DNA helicase IV
MILIVKDRATEDSRLTFRSFEKALEHARLVIVPQIGEAIGNTMVQDDPMEWKDGIEDMSAILEHLYSSDRGLVENAIELWARLAKHDNYGDMWVELEGSD